MITIQISVGELLDRVSALHVRNTILKDVESLKEIEIELKQVTPLATPFLKIPKIDDLYSELMNINFDLYGEQYLLEAQLKKDELIKRINRLHRWFNTCTSNNPKETATKELLEDICSWEMELSEYASLESILNAKYVITKK